jgi:hypothetical protein
MELVKRFLLKLTFKKKWPLLKIASGNRYYVSPPTSTVQQQGKAYKMAIDTHNSQVLPQLACGMEIAEIEKFLELRIEVRTSWCVAEVWSSVVEFGVCC